MLDLYLLRFDTLVPEAPCFVFYATSSQVYCRFDPDDMVFASTLIWYHTHTHTLTHTHTHTHTVHTGTNRLTHKYILKLSVAHSSYLYCIELIAHWYQFILWRSAIYIFLKITHIQKSHICWLDAVKLSPSCETKNNDRNCVNEQKKYTHVHTRTHTDRQTQREEDDIRKG